MYNNREKSHAIRQLIINLGDIDRTAEQTGVSKSTLHRWKNELKSYENIVFWEQDSKSRVIQAQYEGIRDKMLTQIQRLLERMDYYGPEFATDYANAVARLTDRIVKVESLLEMSGQYAVTVDLSSMVDMSDKQEQREQRLSDPADEA